MAIRRSICITQRATQGIEVVCGEGVTVEAAQTFIENAFSEDLGERIFEVLGDAEIDYERTKCVGSACAVSDADLFIELENGQLVLKGFEREGPDVRQV